MEKKYLNLLSMSVKAIVHELESKTQKEIIVTEDAPNPNYGCVKREKHWHILVPDFTHIRPGSILHELLHIERIELNDLPRLESNSISYERIISEIDNQLEHLLIFPREFTIDPDRRSFWGTLLHQRLQQLEMLENDGVYLRGLLLLTWSLIHHSLPSKNLKKRVRELMKKHYILDDAAAFHLKVMENLNDKFSLTEHYVLQFGIPFDEVELVQRHTTTNLNAWIKHRNYNVTKNSDAESSYRAVDIFGRIVYFESKTTTAGNDIFFASNTENTEGYYRVRHRKDGPAIIGIDGSRRWFINNVEHTIYIETALKNIKNPFYPKSTDYRLNKEAQVALSALKFL